MNSEELKNLIESARVEKGISQRELAKLTGISRSTLNDLINGKIKQKSATILDLMRRPGIEPGPPAWKASILPLN